MVSPRKNLIIFFAVLYTLIFICYGQTIDHDFVWDSRHIFSDQAPEFSHENLVWVLTAKINANWHPLTLFTHLVDYVLYGWSAGGHHISNIVFHCLAATLCFFVIRRLLTIAEVEAQASFVIASITVMIFALHPLRVESVAWVAARKDLTYSCFYLLSIYFYLRYTERQASMFSVPYMAAVAFFLLSLLSKSMAVTLPAVLVCLDYFPIRRIKSLQQYLREGLIDKLPFALMALAIIIVTVTTQTEAMADQRLSILAQFTNMTHNIMFYVEKFFVPIGLVPFYPFPSSEYFYSPMYWLPQLIAILLISGTALWFAVKGKPLYLICWLIYLIMLSPASGVIQVGSAAAADRYTYLTLLPLSLLVTIGLVSVWYQYPGIHRTLLLSGFLGITTLVGLTFIQVGHWKTPITMWSHVLRHHPSAALAHRNLASAYLNEGYFDKTIEHLMFLADSGWPVAPLLAEAYETAELIPEGIKSLRQRIVFQSPRNQERTEHSLLKSKSEQTYEEALRLLSQSDTRHEVDPLDNEDFDQQGN